MKTEEIIPTLKYKISQLNLLVQDFDVKDNLDIISKSIETLNSICKFEFYKLQDPNTPVEGDWLVVVDDSDCTVGVGGPGKMLQLESQSSYYKDCWQIKGIGSPYRKSVFRKATPEEVKNKLADENYRTIPWEFDETALHSRIF